jgi:hypothetical protein
MEHDDLADVKPLGVRIQISDGVHGMWMGKELAELRNYGVPWTNETILNYFEDLVNQISNKQQNFFYILAIL